MATSTEHATSPPTLDERFSVTRERIAEAARRSGRRAEEILLVAVTKYAEPEDIRRLLELGHRDFGESRVQQLVQRASMAHEWLDRVRVLRSTSERERADGSPVLGSAETGGHEPPEIRWHMIGSLQRNKARKVVELGRLLHSVENLRVAEEIQAALLKTERRFDILIQVNIAGEAKKHGVAVPAVAALAEQLDSIYHCRVRGLMCMAPYSENPEDARPHFARCRELFDEVKKLGIGEGRFNLLSMGMSGDFEVGIEEGANIVRVGSGLFGERDLSGDDASDAGDDA